MAAFTFLSSINFSTFHPSSSPSSFSPSLAFSPLPLPPNLFPLTVNALPNAATTLPPVAPERSMKPSSSSPLSIGGNSPSSDPSPSSFLVRVNLIDLDLVGVELGEVGGRGKEVGFPSVSNGRGGSFSPSVVERSASLPRTNSSSSSNSSRERQEVV